jgi:magnesium chelatase family protein
MVARTRGAVLVGIEARIVDVEADVTARGLPGTTIVGLADTVVNEARERVRAAILNSELPWPATRVMIALLPASWRKRGSSLDLALAVSVLADSGEIPADRVAGLLVIGELGLDGSVRGVAGVVAAAIAARDCGVSRLIVPQSNAREAALVPGLDVVGVGHLLELVGALRGDRPWPAPPEEVAVAAAVNSPDLSDVRGQFEARRALEIAAAGGHHMSMVGTPGVGKSLLAERLPGLLPELDDDAALEVTSISSAAGRLTAGRLVRVPPFAAPHHRASPTAVIGGGQGGRIQVGAITLAHRGVLFLDEAPEFDRRVLESLRQPLETGRIEVSRADIAVWLPARVHLILAANPCPCGQGLGAARSCTCTPQQRRTYATKLSGPLLDRVDLRLILQRPSLADLRAEPEGTSVVAQRVAQARERSGRRWREVRTPSGQAVRVNGDIPGPLLRKHFPPDLAGQQALAQAFDTGALTLRGADRVLKIAWTLADLADRDQPGRDEIGYAMSLRGEALGWAA